MNIVTVRVNGVEYNLKGNEKEEYLHKVASYVDKKVKAIMDKNTKLSTSSAAILSAINVVDDLFKCDLAYEGALSKLENIVQKETDLQEQVELLKKQLLHMEQYNGELQEKVKNGRDEKGIQEKDLLIAERDAQIAEKDAQINRMTQEFVVAKETVQQYMETENKLKAENKELKFQVQSAKYKIIDLQNRLIDNQIDLAKAKKKVSGEINVLNR